MNSVVLLTMPLASHDADANDKSVKWLKKSCCILFRLCWTNKCSGAIDDSISVVWFQPWYLMTRKVMLYLIAIILTLKLKWYHWQCHQCHVILALVPTASHNQNSHVTPCFSCPYLMKKDGAIAGANGNTWLEKVLFHLILIMVT